MDRSKHRYESHGVTIVYNETGASWGADADHVFVLIHGIGMGRTVYDDVAPILAARGRVIALDLPGFGDSPEPGTEASIEETAVVLARFVRELGIRRVILVGHSMGTQVAAQLAADEPELVKGLVLIAPTINRHERTAAKQAERMMQDLKGEGVKVFFTGLFEYFKTNPVWFVRKLNVMLQHRLEDVCPRVQVPTLVLSGETDPVCPREWVAEVAAALPESTMHLIPDRGHEAIIKSPEPASSMILEYVPTLSSR